MHCYQTLHSTTWARRLYRVHNVHLRIVHRVHTVHQIGDDAASSNQQSDLILMTSVYIAYLSDHTYLSPYYTRTLPNGHEQIVILTLILYKY